MLSWNLELSKVYKKKILKLSLVSQNIQSFSRTQGWHEMFSSLNSCQGLVDNITIWKDKTIRPLKCLWAGFIKNITKRLSRWVIVLFHKLTSRIPLLSVLVPRYCTCSLQNKRALSHILYFCYPKWTVILPIHLFSQCWLSRKGWISFNK